MDSRTLLIDGHWRSSIDGATFDVCNPATEKVIGAVSSATPEDVDAAADAAHRAWDTWRRTDPWRRTAVLRRTAELLEERRDEIAVTLSQEQGKPLAEANGELTASIEVIDWCADEARRIYGRVVPARDDDTRIFITRKAVGPIAAFTASNFPALLAARKLGAAIAAGCSVVLKPAEDTPYTALALAQAFADAGLPAGVLNVVTGRPAEIADRLIESDAIRKISLTGSVPVGRTLLTRAADRIIPSSMELGGHAPCLVFPDADIETAADMVVQGKWRNNGQVCISVSRLLVHEAIVDDFVALLSERMSKLVIGPGDAASSDVGPLVNESARGRADDLLGDATSRGGEVRVGGGRPAHLSTGYYFEPTLLTGVPAEARIWREEPFGPVLPVRSFSTAEEGIEIANQVPYGLAGYVFTRDLSTALRVSDELEAGMVGVNRLVIATAEAPAGGVKASGFGREGGAEALDDYTVTTYVNVRL